MSPRRPFCIALVLLAASNAHAAVFPVTSAADAGAGTLRDAVAQANASEGPDTIVFDLPEAACSAAGVCRIDLATGVVVTDDVLVDGTTQPRFGAAPENVCATESAPSFMRVEIVGPNVLYQGTVRIAHAASPSGTTLRGLAIGGGAAIAIVGSGAHRVQCSHVGVNGPGNAALPTEATTVNIEGSADGAILGTDGDGVDDFGERNVFAALFSHVIYVNANSHLRVSGNFFGLAADGTSPLGCGYGFYTRQTSYANLVGSDFDGVSDALERNVFGACEFGVWLANGASAPGGENVVAGNWIGVDALGNPAPSTWDGILLTTGGGSVVRYNRIEGNAVGVRVEGTDTLAPGSEGNCFAGNGVGLQHAGSAALAFERNWWGAADGPTGDVGGSGDAVEVTGGGSADVVPFLTEGCPAPEPDTTLGAVAALAALALRRARARRPTSRSVALTVS